MAGLHYKPAGIWENKFRSPTADDLLGALSKTHAQLVEAARARLREAPASREEIVWNGLPWRWTFSYRGEGEPARFWAYVVPEPARPRIVLPLTLDELSRLPLRKLTKTVRDPLAHGVEVDGVHWVEWELTSRALLDEVLTLARHRVPAHSGA